MNVNGINAADQILTANTQLQAQTQKTDDTNEKLAKGLAGDGGNEVAGEIKAKEPTDEELMAQNEKMSHKEAKEWLKQYREETGCSKREAREAFKSEFGYEVPRSKFVLQMRASFFPTYLYDLITNNSEAAEFRKSHRTIPPIMFRF